MAAKAALAKGYIHRLRATDDGACANILRGDTLGQVGDNLRAAFLVRLHRKQVRMPRTEAVIELVLQSRAKMRVLVGAYFLAEGDCERSREWLTKATEVESTRVQALRLLLVERVMTHVQRDEIEEAKKGARELLKMGDRVVGDTMPLFRLSLGICQCIGCAASNQEVPEAWAVPRRCRGCDQFYYCSTECQERHRADGHKKVCREWKDAKVLPNDAVAHALAELRVRARQLHDFLVRSTNAGGVACGPGFVEEYTKLSDVLRQKEERLMEFITVRDQAKTAIRAK